MFQVVGTTRRIPHKQAIREAVADALRNLADEIEGKPAEIEGAGGRFFRPALPPCPKTIEVTIQHAGDVEYQATVAIAEELPL